MTSATRPLAIVTGASSGIGYELAKCCAAQGFDLLIAADQPSIHHAAQEFRALGAAVEAVEADLATLGDVDRLYAATHGRAVEVLLANAGHGFLDQDFEAVWHVIDTNITGSAAGFMPGTFQAVYGGTKAFLNAFSFALRNELRDTGVTVTGLMPGATETAFFARADMLDTAVGQQEKDDPADVARAGFVAMKQGEGDVVTG